MLGFVEKDIEDILQLFPVSNKATHGAAGTISFATLEALRQRVEGGIMFPRHYRLIGWIAAACVGISRRPPAASRIRSMTRPAFSTETSR